MRPLLPLVGVLALSACAAPTSDGPTKAAGARECFWANSVNGFTDAGPNHVRVNVGASEVWELELFGGCPDVDWAQRIAVVSRGSSRICSGLDAELIVPEISGRDARRCSVRSVRKLTPEEAAAPRR